MKKSGAALEHEITELIKAQLQKPTIETSFIAGEDIPRGTAVWLHCHRLMRADNARLEVCILHCHRLMRADNARLEVCIPLGGPIHTPMVIGVACSHAKRGRALRVVQRGHVKLPRERFHKEWFLKTAWATDHGHIVPWELVARGRWAKRIGWFTHRGVMVILTDHQSKRK